MELMSYLIPNQRANEIVFRFRDALVNEFLQVFK
jgi:hypothetical protein